MSSYYAHQPALPGGDDGPTPHITSAAHPSRGFRFGPDDYEKAYKSAVEVQYVEAPYPRRISVPRRRAAPDYKPFPLRWQFLAATVAAIAAVIAAAASACVVLPAEVDRSFVPSAQSLGARAAAAAITPFRASPRVHRARARRQNGTEPPAPAIATETLSAPSAVPTLTTTVPTLATTVPPISWPSSTLGATGVPSSTLTTVLPGGEVATQSVGSSVPTPSGSSTANFRGSATTKTSGYVPYHPPSSNYASQTVSMTNEWTDLPPPAAETEPIMSVLGPFPTSRAKTVITTKVPVTGMPPPTSKAPAAYASLTVTVTSVESPPSSTPKPVSDEYIAGLTGWMPTRVGTSSVTILLPGAPGVRTSLFTDINGAGIYTTITSIVVEGLPENMKASVVTLPNPAGAPGGTMVTMLVRETPPAYVRPSVITLRGPNGVATATFTSTPRPMSTPRTIIETNAMGVPTLTYVTSVSATPRPVTYTNEQGVTTTGLEYPVNPTDSPSVPAGTVVKVYEVSNGAYFVGFFLPPIISALLTIPIRMIDLSAKQFQPWHELTRVKGATADQSLCLRTGGIHGLASSVRSLAGGQALVFLTTLLTLCSVALVPLSSEAIALKLHGSCVDNDFRGCAMSLGVFLGPAKAALALLVCMVFLIVMILVALKRWKSGVTANPWTMAGIASLSMSREIRTLFSLLPKGVKGRIEHGKLVRALSGKTFKLGYFSDYPGVPEYGIVIHREVAPGLPRAGSKLSLYLKRSRESVRPSAGSEENGEELHLPFLMLSFTWRIAFLLFLTGVLVIIAYYNSTSGDTPFERFMATQNLGARALFTLVGVGISFYWSSFFTSLAILSPYHILSQDDQPAERSLLLSAPLHAITGISSAIRRGNPFLVVVAATSIMAEFMPILLNNVPFRLTQTYMTHMVCTWLAVGVLCFMWLVVAGSFFVRWPHMPVDPSTIAGAMYYVCDSRMLSSFEGLSVLPKAQRDLKVCEMGARFRFGAMTGVSGARRIGVDRVHDQEQAVFRTRV